MLRLAVTSARALAWVKPRGITAPNTTAVLFRRYSAGDGGCVRRWDMRTSCTEYPVLTPTGGVSVMPSSHTYRGFL